MVRNRVEENPENKLKRTNNALNSLSLSIAILTI